MPPSLIRVEGCTQEAGRSPIAHTPEHSRRDLMSRHMCNVKDYCGVLQLRHEQFVDKLDVMT